MRPGADVRQFLWLVRRYLAPHWPSVAILLVTSYLAVGLAALFPVLMAPILDLALGRPLAPVAGGNGIPLHDLSLKNLGAAFFQWVGLQTLDDRFQVIVLLSVLYAAAGVAKGGVDFASYLLALWIRARAATAIRIDLFRHLLGLSLGFFNREKTGELVSRLYTDTHGATGALDAIARTLLTAPILVAVYGYLLVRTSPPLVVAAAAAAVLHYFVSRGIRDPIRRLATDEFSLSADLSARFHESILSIRVIKSFGAEAFEVARLGRLLRNMIRTIVKYGVYKHVGEPARGVVNYVVEAAILVLAAYELLAGRLAAPAFFLFLYVGRVVLVQLGLIGEAYAQIQTTLAASSRVAALFAQVPQLTDGPDSISEFRERIVVSDVTFDYGGERVLHQINLEIRRGEVVALVGSSGVGKSTLADLILRLYDPVEGWISIDGSDVRTLRQDAYRRLFGVVSQEPLLFNATIRENIAYGREGIADDEFKRAAQVANAHDFIMEFPRGYDTVVGDRGVRLSGGQRQRVAIARAIVGNPPILILDEATSSLDTESERLVQEAIDRVIRGTTCIVIAHRLSTVAHADKIVVMNRGRIEALGSHAELLATSDTYGRLYRAQFAERAAQRPAAMSRT